jgi:hypothetical protein
MKQKWILSVVLATTFVFGITCWLAAQTDMPLRQQVTVNFENPVIVGQKTLQPGHYLFREIQNNPTVFEIYKENGKKPEFQTLATQTTIDTRVDPGTPARTRFVLLQVGDNYYLSKLWLGGQAQGWDFLTGTAMANKAGKEVNVEANSGSNQSGQSNSVGRPQ